MAKATLGGHNHARKSPSAAIPGRDRPRHRRACRARSQDDGPAGTRHIDDPSRCGGKAS